MSPSRAVSNLDAVKRVRNPFLNSVLANPLEENPSDVPEINSVAFNKCRNVIEDVREQHITQALLLFGEPGAGKTHLLSRLRAQLEHDAATGSDSLFTYIRMVTTAPMLWRFLRRHLAFALIRNRAFAQVIKRDRDEIAAEDRNLGIVLGNLNDGLHYSDSAAWLRGQELPEDVLKTLGLAAVGEEEGQEAASRNVVLTLCRLIEPVPIVFCFDQLEALRSFHEDTAGFFKLGQIVSDLHDSTRNVAMISCLQTSMVKTFEESIHSADVDRMMRRRAGLDPISPDQAMKLVEARLATIPELSGQQPIKSKDLQDLFAADNSCTARQVVARCQEVFREWANQPPPPAETLPEVLERKLRAHHTTPLMENADAILRTGLPSVLRIRGVRVAPTGRANKVLEGLIGNAKPAAVAICNQKAGLPFINRLTMAEQEWQNTGAAGLIVLRDARNGIGATAVRSLAAIKRLEKAGARFVSVKPEALAVLDAITRLLADARSGDLTYQGNSVPAATVEDWLRTTLPPAVDQLVDEVSGVSYTPPDELAGMLLDLLGKSKVISLEEAARQLGQPAAEIEACARRNPELVAIAGGPRPALFRIVERHD